MGQFEAGAGAALDAGEVVPVDVEACDHNPIPIMG